MRHCKICWRSALMFNFVVIIVLLVLAFSGHRHHRPDTDIVAARDAGPS
jgi:hypothetical protein